MTKLTQEQIAQLPELMAQTTQREIARLWGVSAQNVAYWVRQYRKRGVGLPKTSRLSTIDEIIKKRNEQANITT